MRDHDLRKLAISLATIPLLAACHAASQPPGMDAKDLSDDRGARAGGFNPASDNAAAIDNRPTMGNDH